MANRKYIVKSSARQDNRPVYFTSAIWAVSATFAGMMERGRLYIDLHCESVKILSSELDPHAS